MIRVLFVSIVLFFFQSCNRNHPIIVIETDMGSIQIELYPEKAPVTVANFLKYIDENRLDSATFYRTVTMDNQLDNNIKIEVIQGGLYDDFHPQALPPIEHETTKETCILHKDGVISMARNEPGTATCEFFICVGDQPSLDYGGLRNPDGQGFAAFGKVIGGMDIVNKIHQSNAEGQWLKPRIKILSLDY